jgi:hypothetical protein
MPEERSVSACAQVEEGSPLLDFHSSQIFDGCDEPIPSHSEKLARIYLR